MTFIEQWRAQLTDSLAEFARLAAQAQDIDFTHGLLAAAVLWPIRAAVQDFDDEAIDAVRAIAGVQGKHALRAVQGWDDDDPLEAARDLAAGAATNAELAQALNAVIQHFDAGACFASHLADQYASQLGGDTAGVAEQIQAALVNVGGVINIQSLTLQLALAGPSQPQLQIPPPPEPGRPPAIDEFVGRQAELTAFAQKLKDEHLAVITGMAGVGKTTLAAALAEVWQVWQMLPPLEADAPLDSTILESMLTSQDGDHSKLFWHSFYEGEGVNAVIWKMAGFLAWHGQEELWHMLQTARQTGGQLPPPGTLFDYLFQMIRGQGYLLCLDDFQFVDDDPLLGDFVERLQQLVLSGEASLIITSRRTPKFVEAAEYEPLAGLNAPDVRRLLVARGLSLADTSVTELYTQTGGNAQLLILAINILKRAKDPAQVITRLTEVDDLERYLMREVDDSLTEADREVMMGVAVLMGYPGTRDAIETVAARNRLKRLLLELSNRHLLVVHKQETGEAYSQHAMVQAFYYDMPGRRERREMHRRAGEYYEVEEPDVLKAALHFERAGAYERAAELATADVRTLINQGQAQALRRLLEHFTPQQLSPEGWVMVNIARGSIYTFLRESQLARDSYQQALCCLTALPDPAKGSEDNLIKIRHLKAQAYRGMGDLLEFESPPEALKWLVQGLEEAAGVNAHDQAALHLKVGAIRNEMGNYPAALSAIQQGLDLLPEGPSQLRAYAMLNLGIIHCVQGDVERGHTALLHGLEISQHLHDYFLMVDILTNLAVEKFITGDWAGAVVDYRQALTLAERLGNLYKRAALNHNLGDLYAAQGDHQMAVEYLSHSLELARQGNLPEVESVSLCDLAHVHLRRGEPDAAVSLLAEANRLALEMDVRYILPQIYCGWAQVHLAQGAQQAAVDWAEQALSVARELEADCEEGMSWRTLGQALRANGEIEPALSAFAHSLSLLADRDPYEAARTQAAWGHALAGGQDLARGTSLLQAARATFERLGAQGDLAEVEEMLGVWGVSTEAARRMP